MEQAGGLHTQAIGTAAPGQRVRCMFCHTLLENEGDAFLDHLDRSPDCRNAYEAWLANLDYDRPGGG